MEVRDVATRIARFPFVEEIKYGEDWVQKLDFLQNLAVPGPRRGERVRDHRVRGDRATINIVLISREDEIAIMKMVGATRAFIARPLVIEGFVKGVLGAVLALVLLTLTYSVLEQRVVSLGFYSPLQIVGGFLLGGALGAVASIVTLRRHLAAW